MRILKIKSKKHYIAIMAKQESQLAGATRFILILVCIIFLVFVVWKIYRDNFRLKDVAWPPEIYKCPDYWTFENGTCNNKEKLGKGEETVEPIQPGYNNRQLKRKCRWTKKNKVPWHGVDNLC